MQDLLVLCQLLYLFIIHGLANVCETPSLFLPQTGTYISGQKTEKFSAAIPCNPISATKETLKKKFIN